MTTFKLNNPYPVGTTAHYEWNRGYVSKINTAVHNIPILLNMWQDSKNPYVLGKVAKLKKMRMQILLTGKSND